MTDDLDIDKPLQGNQIKVFYDQLPVELAPHGADEAYAAKIRTTDTALREFFAEKPITLRTLVEAVDHLKTISSLDLTQPMTILEKCMTAYNSALASSVTSYTEREKPSDGKGGFDAFNAPGRGSWRDR